MEIVSVMNYQRRIKSKKGFTLIEMLVVAALLFTVGVVVVQLFFSSLKSGSKSTILLTVKENGDYALTVMERMIRNSREVQLCSLGTVRIRNPDENFTVFECDNLNKRIASNGASLISGHVAVSCDSLFNCQLTNGKLTKIGINFTVSQNLPVPKLEETAQMDFTTVVTLRNY